MWDLISFVKSKTRRFCLEALYLGPATPGDIAKSSGAHLSHISRALRELTDKDLATCLTPNSNKNRIYGITDKGKEVLENLRKMEKKMDSN